jgi:hypothetical protein
MLLPVPIPTLTIGPDWAQYLYSCLYSQVDAHDHSSGMGVQIQPDGLNISGSLTFQGNAATNLLASGYLTQTSPLSLSTYTNYLYVSGGNLYYNSASTQIQLTTPTAVNATSTGISDGSGATASFVSKVLVVNKASNTPATIQAGTYKMGDETTDGLYVTITPPTLTSSYPLVLPALPSVPSFMQLANSSGIMSASIPISQGITATNIANATITTTQVAASTLLGSNIASTTVTNTNLAATNATQSSNIIYTSTATTATTVTGSNTGGLVVTGFRYILITLQPNGGAGAAGYINLNVLAGTQTTQATLVVQRSMDGGVTWTNVESTIVGSNGSSVTLTYSPSIINVYDIPSAGTVEYRLQGSMITNATQLQIQSCVLRAIET